MKNRKQTLKKRKKVVSKPVAKRATTKKPKPSVTAAKPKGGYAVELRVENDSATKQPLYATHVGSKRDPLTLKAAEEIRDGLKSAGSAGRIIMVPDGTVHETWEGIADVEAAQREEEMSVPAAIPHGVGAGTPSGNGSPNGSPNTPESEK